MYHANFLRFMERARTEWLGALGMDIAILEREHRVAFAVHRLEIEYVRPARLGDRLHAGVQLLHCGRSRLVVHQTVRLGSDVVARARVTLACLDAAQWKPARIPASLLSRLMQAHERST
ncbi:MAG: thioesterase family protein [Pseudomonadota bacterium]|nr:thioesterase family protein [Pseudomonadota bacterium]